jgi:phage gpG-like protein
LVAVPVTGDFAKLADMVKDIRELASSSAKARLNKNLAQEARNQMVQGFIEMQDPYGITWAKTKRGGQILRKTTRMMNSVRAEADENSFRLATDVVYAAVHQYGAKIAPHSRVQAQSRAVNRKGKFISWKAAAKLKRPPNVRVMKRATFANGITIPQRQFLPGDGKIGPIWMNAFRSVVSVHMAKLKK